MKIHHSSTPLPDDLPRLKAALLSRAEDLCRYLLPGGRREGHNYVTADLRGGKGASFSVCLSGEKAGVWKDFATGEGGDNLLELLRQARGLSFGEACREAREWLGLPSALPIPATAPIPKPTAPRPIPAFDWQACVDALTPDRLTQVAEWRGLSVEFCQWAHGVGLLGSYNDFLALPVQGTKGEVIGCHYRRDDGTWRYHPPGVAVGLLVIGDPATAAQVHVFESQWDGFAVADVLGFVQPETGLPEETAFIATRGMSNAKLAVEGLNIRPGVEVFAWGQNDDPGRDWLAGVAEAGAREGLTVRAVATPAPHKDANDWTSAGATAGDLLDAMKAAVPVVASAVSPVAEVAPELLVDDAAVSAGAAPFPVHCLPPAAVAMVEAVCASERIPEALAGPVALGILSAATGAGLEVRSGPTRTTRAALYVMPSAESGSGKSETVRHFARPLSDYEREVRTQWRAEALPGLEAEAEMLQAEIGRLRKDAAKADNAEARAEVRERLKCKLAALAQVEADKQEPALCVEDVTTEKLAALLARPGETLSVLSADAGAVVNNLLGRYAKGERTDENIYLKGWTGETYRVDRMGRVSIVLERPWMSALLLVQPDKVESLLAVPALSEGGLLPRFLICHTGCQPREITADDPPGVPAEVAADWYALVRVLLETSRVPVGTPTVVLPDPAAKAQFDAYHNAIVRRWKTGRLHDVGAFSARWAEQAWRIGLCLHAGLWGAEAGEHPMVEGTALAAVELAEWFAGQQLAILDRGRRERRRARLERLRELVAKGPVTLRDLERRHGFEAREVHRLAGEFPALLAVETQATGGRPSEVVTLPTATPAHR